MGDSLPQTTLSSCNDVAKLNFHLHRENLDLLTGWENQSSEPPVLKEAGNCFQTIVLLGNWSKNIPPFVFNGTIQSKLSMNCLLCRKFALHDVNFLIFCTTCGQGKEENMDIPVHVSAFCFWLFSIKVVFSGIEGKCSSRSNLTRFPTFVCIVKDGNLSRVIYPLWLGQGLLEMQGRLWIEWKDFKTEKLQWHYETAPVLHLKQNIL